MRFVLKFFSGNSNAEFVKAVYTITQPIVNLFGNVFPSNLIENQYIFESNTLLALVVISIAGHLFFEFLDMLVYALGKKIMSKKPTLTDLQYRNQKQEK